ncbi:MAG: sialate O-acetylesterase [Candidatus Sumerlaeaceae bacterium]
MRHDDPAVARMRRFTGILVATFLCVSKIGASEGARLTFASVFTDHMVLQRDRPVPIWGSATPGSKVRLVLASENSDSQPPQRVVTTTDSSGRWRAELQSMPAGGPFRLRLTGTDQDEDGIVLTDVLFGDVWLCSGQSNMGFPLSRAVTGKQDGEQSSNTQLRLLRVTGNPSPAPVNTLKGAPSWQICGPESSPVFSAVGYYFGRDLQKQLNVPVGLIQSSVGGTAAECWVSRGGLQGFPEFASQIAKIDLEAREPGNAQANYQRDLAKWYEELRQKDPGYGSSLASSADSQYAGALTPPIWASPEFHDEDWQSTNQPARWISIPDLKDFIGTVWLRREVTLKDEFVGTTLTLSLGQITDEDITWFNGKQAGETITAKNTRQYTIPAEWIRPGRNVITVRVLGNSAAAGFTSDAQQLKLIRDTGLKPVAAEPLSLGGEWKTRKGVSLAGLTRRPTEAGHPRRPMVLYNGMIAPLAPYALKGAIWYQGESNVTRADQYRKLFPALIADWREKWKSPSLPFLFAQLPFFHAREQQPGEDKWAELREAQLKTFRSVPATGMAVTIDTGDAKDIHPTTKEPVGARLALAARAISYGEKLVWSGPLFTTSTVEGAAMRIGFEHIGSGLSTQDHSSTLRGFAIAGADRIFVWADARIDTATNTVLVSGARIPQPTAVRYAWAANPDCNLCNREGLPASPFRTDDWPGVTAGNTKDSVTVP